MQPDRRTGNNCDWKALREVINKKGWTLSNLAFRWGVTLRHVSRALRSDSIDLRWIDAVHGLPMLTRQEARELQRKRIAENKAHKTAKAGQEEVVCEQTSYLVPGSVLIAIETWDAIEEGDEVVVAKVRPLASGEVMVAVRLPMSDDLIWFGSESDLWSCMVETGREEKL